MRRITLPWKELIIRCGLDVVCLKCFGFEGMKCGVVSSAVSVVIDRGNSQSVDAVETSFKACEKRKGAYKNYCALL